MLGFNPLSSTPISSLLSGGASAQSSVFCEAIAVASLQVKNECAAQINATATTSSQIDLAKGLSSQIDATAVASAQMAVDKNMSTQIDATATTSSQIAVDNNASTQIDATAVIQAAIFADNQLSSSVIAQAEAAGSAEKTAWLGAALLAEVQFTGDLTLVNNLESGIQAEAIAEAQLAAYMQANISADCQISADLSCSIESSIFASSTAAATVRLDNNASAQIEAVAEFTGVLFIDKYLESAIQATVETQGSIEIVLAAAASIEATATVAATFDLLFGVSADVTATATTNATLDVDLTLSASINATATAELFFAPPVDLSTTVEATATTNAVLLVEVIPGDGFYPPITEFLASHVESAPTETYSITANFGADVQTEITSIITQTNPSGVITTSAIGNTALITANTPKIVYAASSSYTVDRELIPTLGKPIDYAVRFNTKLKKSKTAPNFYSDKFSAENGSTCYLADDGLGNIKLIEQVTPSQTKIIRKVGVLDYENGSVRVTALNIQGAYATAIKFYGESFDANVPTKDYFSEKNANLVQSRTLSFPNNEQVEIYKYDKSSTDVTIAIQVKARSFSPSNPSVTIEERTATYQLKIVPDYDIGKIALKKAIEEQNA